MIQGHVLGVAVRPANGWQRNAGVPRPEVDPHACSSAEPLSEQRRSAWGFAWILKATPLLWVSGLLAFCSPLWIVYSFLKDRCWKQLRDPAVAGWFAIAAFQGLSTIINWGNTTEGLGTLIYRFLSAPISGWVFLGMLIALGKQIRFNDDERLAKAAVQLGLYLLCLGLPLLLIGTAFGITDLQWLTPVGHLIPSSLPSAQFGFTAQFLIVDDFVGQTVPRLVLFYPWPTCLGFAGAAILFISLTKSRRRAISFAGICGGVFGVLASTSRAAIVGTIAALVVFGVLQRPQRKRLIAILGIVTAVLLCMCAPLLFQTDPAGLILGTKDHVSALRQDSSSARQALYDESYKRFKRAPYLGYGWQGDILQDTIPLPVGSHSTIYGLLYTGGLLTLVPFLFAVAALGLQLLQNARTGTRGEHAAFCIYIVLIVMCYGECIFSFAIPVFFAFLWIGGGLRKQMPDVHPARSPAGEPDKESVPQGHLLGRVPYLAAEASYRD
jgi:hypothetical protein